MDDYLARKGGREMSPKAWPALLLGDCKQHQPPHVQTFKMCFLVMRSLFSCFKRKEAIAYLCKGWPLFMKRKRNKLICWKHFCVFNLLQQLLLCILVAQVLATPKLCSIISLFLSRNVSLMHFKTLWIKASADCMKANCFMNDLGNLGQSYWVVAY